MSWQRSSARLLPALRGTALEATDADSMSRALQPWRIVGGGLVLATLIWVALALRSCQHGGNDRGEPEAFVAGKQQSMTHMVMVAGHSVYTGADYAQAKDNSNWFLMDYQQIPGTAESFVQHMEAGVKATAEDAKAVLVFSGGYTRREAGARSEAGSYWQVAHALGWFGNQSVEGRALIEDRARDSFENLLFSICRFRQFTGGYPRKITIVSYDFKKERFEQVHAAALGLPTRSVDFIGTPALDATGAQKGESATLQAFKRDIYACRGDLARKKAARDPFAMGVPTSARCPALRPFMTGTCMTKPYKGPLPWRRAGFGRASQELHALRP